MHGKRSAGGSITRPAKSHGQKLSIRALNHKLLFASHHHAPGCKAAFLNLDCLNSCCQALLRTLECIAGGVRVDQQQGDCASVGQDDPQHHRHLLPRQERPAERVRGRERNQHHHLCHGRQPGHAAAGAQRGGLHHPRRVLQQGCQTHRPCQGACSPPLGPRPPPPLCAPKVLQKPPGWASWYLSCCMCVKSEHELAADGFKADHSLRAPLLPPKGARGASLLPNRHPWPIHFQACRALISAFHALKTPAGAVRGHQVALVRSHARLSPHLLPTLGHLLLKVLKEALIRCTVIFPPQVRVFWDPAGFGVLEPK